MPATLLRGATTHRRYAPHACTGSEIGEHVRIDVRIVEERIAAIGDLAPEPGDEVVDLDGSLLLPAPVEPHAHLDKAFLAEVLDNPTGDLLGAIEVMTSSRARFAVSDIVDRAERAARLMARNGFRAVRSHADTTLDSGLRHVQALLEVKRRVADVIDVQVVALSGWPLLGRAGADQRALLADALDAGVDVVGGCPHLEGTGTRGPTELLLGLAADRGLAVDLHTDETLDGTMLGLVDLAEIVSGGFAQPVTASHCVSLGMLPAERQRAIAEQVAAAGIRVVALPQTNLYLQGRGQAPMPRALTAVSALTAAGVHVAAGADNLQDPFNPLGRACAFETAGLMVLAAHLRPDAAFAAVADEAAGVVGAEPVMLAPGDLADLVAVRAATLREAIAYGPSDRIVWRRGRRLVVGGT